MNQARTRFAPSPTGLLHVGGVRTALFAWLVARQTNGKFILRLEDTDQTRKMVGADQHIMDSLKWVGLQWDEGPDKGGPHGPYMQSERLPIYKEWAEKLISAGRAYADPYTVDEVNAFREEAKTKKLPFMFRNNRPTNTPKWNGKTPLRFKSDPKPYNWRDEVMGKLATGPEAIDDFVLIKADGYPTYNFAHIIDDYLMEITHVIRSQEFISSVPNYLNLYEALEFKAPVLATVPIVLGPDGKKKLSKRDGAKDILDYAADGFLPEAMFNFLATLGWNDGTTQEIFSKKELIERFNLGRVQRSSAKFDDKRLLWTNGYYIRNLPLEILLDRVSNYWPTAAITYQNEYKLTVLALVQDRLKYFSELPSLTNFFFEDLPVNMKLIKDNPAFSNLSNDDLHSLLEKAKEAISKSDFSTADLTNKLNRLLESTGQKPNVLFSLIRIVTSWADFSPGLAETLAVLGKNSTLRRLTVALNNI